MQDEISVETIIKEVEVKIGDIISPTEAADILGVTVQRVSALCLSGQVTYRKIGCHKFPFRASVLAYRDKPSRYKRSPKHGRRISKWVRERLEIIRAEKQAYEKEHQQELREKRLEKLRKYE